MSLLKVLNHQPGPTFAFVIILTCNNFNAIIAVSFSGSSGFFSRYLVDVFLLFLHSKVTPCPVWVSFLIQNSWWGEEVNVLTSATFFSPLYFCKVLQCLLVCHPSLRKFLSALSWKHCQMCQELGTRNTLESVLEKFTSSSSSANSHLGGVSGKQEYSYNIPRLEKSIPFLCQCWHWQFGCHSCRFMAAQGPLGINFSWNWCTGRCFIPHSIKNN